MSTGRYVRIGTADPDGLVAALQTVAAKAVSEPDAGSQRYGGGRHLAGAIVGVLALALVAATFYWGYQPPSVNVGADSMSVSNGLYRSTVPFASIRTATLEVGLPRILRKSNGFAAGDTLRGDFRLDDWGTCRLYINRDSPPFVVVRTVDSYVIVNFKEPERTRVLYAALTVAIDRSHR
jgi:hypothetical protein